MKVYLESGDLVLSIPFDIFHTAPLSQSFISMKNRVIWTISTITFILLLVVGAAYFIYPKDDQNKPNNDDTSFEAWSKWKEKGIHTVKTKAEHEQLAKSLDEHDQGLSVITHSHGQSKLSLHEKHRNKHKKRLRSKKNKKIKKVQ